jgi:hypothetical protein
LVFGSSLYGSIGKCIQITRGSFFGFIPKPSLILQR